MKSDNRCVHCYRAIGEGALERRYGFHAVVYPLASIAMGRSVFAHLRCISLVSFDAFDLLLAAVLPSRVRDRAA